MHHLWHARRLIVVAQFIAPVEPPPQLVVPLFPMVTLDLCRTSPLEAERAHPARFATPWPELRGAALLVLRVPW